MFKRLLRRPSVLALGVRLLGAYLALVYATTRGRRLGAEHIHAAARRDSPLIICFWHERLAMMPMLMRLGHAIEPVFRNRRTLVLISTHRDGQFISDVVRRFGIETVPGSTSREGAMAAVAMARSLQAGDMVCITPDGPRGPRRVAAPGAAQLAALCRLPAYPTAAATSWNLRLGSWDRMMLPLPFGRGVIAVGEPVLVDRKALDAGQALLADRLTACCETADRALGLHPT
jgi:lysophospholipid acyltransferase (LPLAT)-like uncharacterized protein